MTYVFVALGFLAFMATSMLAIDVGMLMTSRNQAQNSADAGALAGATALVFNNWDDRSATGPSVTNALAASRANKVMAIQVDVQAPDVQFLADPAGAQDRVKVTVFRTIARKNPVSTLVAAYFKMPFVDISATATAEASPANAVECPLPFTIPDRWTETNTPPFDPSDTFDAVDSKGNPVANPDIYIGPDDKVNYTGYDAARDRGMEVVLKADNGSKLAPSMYQVWDVVGGNRGSDDVRNAIINCRPGDLMGFGDTYVHKPGMQTGPVEQGITDLIAMDPTAYWDPGTNKPVSPFGTSPRIRAIPLFDPYYYDTGIAGGRNASLKFVNYLGFFIEELRGHEVIGRITPIGGLLKGNGGPAPAAAFPRAIRLVQ
jgi:putative Flp pilus-assembly TadE/G-like protein